MRPARGGVGIGRQRAAHGITVWNLDWPSRGRFAWSCVCGQRYRDPFAIPEAASAEGHAHLNAATRPTAGAS